MPKLLMTMFVKLHTNTFLNANFDIDINKFFCRTPRANFFRRQLRSKPHLFQKLRRCKHSYSSPHSIRISTWLDWKKKFHETAYRHFFERKIWQRHEYFLLVKQDQNFLMFQNQLRCINSYSSPQFIWTSPWPDWKALFVELPSDTFLCAKFDNDMSIFFEDSSDRKLICFRNYDDANTPTLALIPLE